MSVVHDPASLSRPSIERFANGPRSAYERGSSIHAVFAHQVTRTPDNVAVVDESGALSYAQLERRANRFARHLRAGGVRPGTAIGVAFERSLNLPVVLLGILKAGCAYVPLDASYPDGRIEFIIADAAISVVVIEQMPDRRRFGSVRLISLQTDEAALESYDDAPVMSDVPSESLAYVMYTSGSTGRPKGVAVPHRGVVRLVRGVDYFATGTDETILGSAPAAFDASTFEIWGALLNGARLAIPRPGLLSIADLGAAVERFSVTTMWLTASLFAGVAEAQLASFEGLRQMLTGGSAGSPQHMVRFLARYPGCRLINGYGPTENTTFSTTFQLASPEAIGVNPPIGRPIANSSAYVLDEMLAPVALGVAGELCVGGDGVALGYLNMPQETAERFVPDPFASVPGAKMYRTGDRVRMRTDGVIEFLGRTDDQVKIHGFRIELGEIEAALRAYPGVRDAAVVAVEREPGDKTLSAHVVAAAATLLDERALREHLRATLPTFMVPPRIAVTAALPLHPSGKIDRVALAAAAAAAATRVPAPTVTPAAPLRPKTLPRPLLNRTVAEIWREALNDEHAPEPDVNFFDAGGDSIRLLRLQSLLNERLDANLTVLDLFEHTTVARIADLIAAGARR